MTGRGEEIVVEELRRLKGGPKKVGTLLLRHNRFNQVPLVLKDFSDLQDLDLGYNSFTFGIDDFVCNMKNLMALDIDHCKLDTFPLNIGSLSGLVHLGASCNNISSLPSSFSCLTKLQYLNISRNKLTRFQCLGSFVRLER